MSPRGNQDSVGGAALEGVQVPQGVVCGLRFRPREVLVLIPKEALP